MTVSYVLGMSLDSPQGIWLMFIIRLNVIILGMNTESHRLHIMMEIHFSMFIKIYFISGKTVILGYFSGKINGPFRNFKENMHDKN